MDTTPAVTHLRSKVLTYRDEISRLQEELDMYKRSAREHDEGLLIHVRQRDDAYAEITRLQKEHQRAMREHRQMAKECLALREENAKLKEKNEKRNEDYDSLLLSGEITRLKEEVEEWRHMLLMMGSMWLGVKESK